MGRVTIKSAVKAFMAAFCISFNRFYKLNSAVINYDFYGYTELFLNFRTAVVGFMAGWKHLGWSKSPSSMNYTFPADAVSEMLKFFIPFLIFSPVSSYPKFIILDATTGESN